MNVITKTIGAEEYVYNVYSRRKKGGGFRKITAPEPRLKDLQRQYGLALYEKVKEEFSADVTGFMPGLSIKDNAARHMCKEWVVNLDIKSFFPSTKTNLVRWALERANCTDDLETAVEVLTLGGALPQGSPASPVISNYVAVHFVDPLVKQVIDSYLVNAEYDYTRYADDITISFNEKLPRLTVNQMVNAICIKLGNETPYKIAANKISLQPKHRRQSVTGVTVNRQFSVKKQDYLNLRAAMHQVRNGQKELDSKLKGKLSFVRSINQNWYEKLTKGINV